MAGKKREGGEAAGLRPAGRPGRRPGVSHTRDEILEAARSEFAVKGYDRTTFRAVAARAQVDPMLLVHYFKNKDGLFLAATALPDDLTERWAAVTSGPLETLGRDIVAFYLSLWDSPETSPQLRAVLASAALNDDASTAMRDVLSDELLTRLAARMKGRDASTRAGLIAGHLVGVALMRYVLALPDMAAPSTAALVKRIGPVVQGYIDGSGADDSRRLRG